MSVVGFKRISVLGCFHDRGNYQRSGRNHVRTFGNSLSRALGPFLTEVMAMLVQMGLCKGVTSKEKMNGIIEHYLVLTAPGRDQFGQETEQSIGVKVSKRQLDSGIENAYKQYIGKQVAVPVYAKAWKSKTGTAFGLDLWLSDDGLPVPVQRVQPRPAAVVGAN